VQQTGAGLLDHLVGAGEQRGRNFDSDRLGRLQVDDELEPSRQPDRHFGRLLALEDTAGIDAGLAILIPVARAIAHQAAGVGKLAPMIYRGHRVARRQRRHLHATGDPQRIWTDQKGIRPHFHEGRKGRIDLAIRAGGHHVDLPPDGQTRRLDFSDKGLGDRRIAGIDERGKARGSRQQLVQEPEPLCSKLNADVADAREVAARPVEAGDKSKLDRVDRCLSGSGFVLDCANDRREYGAAGTAGYHL
jgi:hypothetical protein